MNEDATLAFSAAAGNAISVADVDAAADAIERVLLQPAAGTVTLTSTAGLTSASGLGTASMAIQGTLANLNAALNGLRFTPAANLTGTTTLKVTTSDLGNSGTGGTKTDVDTLSIDLAPVNDPPYNRYTTGMGTYRNQALTLSTANGNAIQLQEVDGDSFPVQVALSSADATMTLAGTAGVTIVGEPNGGRAMTLQGTKGDVDSALGAGLQLTPDPDFTGQAKLTVDTSEVPSQGLSDHDVISIEVDTPEDSIYWVGSKNTLGGRGGVVGRAELDGGGGAHLVETSAVSVDIGIGAAIDVVSGRLYWSGSSTSDGVARIFSVKLDGTDRQVFTTRSRAVNGLAVDAVARRIYWAENGSILPPQTSGAIYYASLDGPGDVGQVDTTGATVTSTPRAIALDLTGGRVYWANSSSQGPGDAGIAFAPLPGSSATAGTLGVPVSQPQGVALDPATNRLFWAEGSGGLAAERLRFATLEEGNLSPASGPFDISPLAGGGLRTPAIDSAAQRIYWVNSAANAIEYASLAGGGSGATLPTGDANVTSPDGAVLLRHPEALSAPAISGTAQVGSTLTCGEASWAADQPNQALYRMPASTAVQWTRDGTAIPAADGATHAPTAAGEYRCVRTATNFAGTTASTSAAVTVAAAPEDPPATPGAQPPTLRFAATRAALSATGVAEVPIVCTAAAGSGCAGSVELAATERIVMTKSSSIAAGARIGSGSINVAAGATTARVTLNEAGRRVASRIASISATITATLVGGAPVTGSLTLTPARAPAITPKSSRATVRNGRASVRVHCAAAKGGRCRGTLTLTARLGGRQKTVAKRTLSLAGGRTTSVSLALSQPARARLRRGSLSARQAVASTIEVGLATQRTRALRLTT